MRIAPILLSAAVAFAVAGCDTSSTSTALGPFTSFEARCAKLPYTPPEVVLLPIKIVADDSRSLAELTTMFDRA